MPNNCKCDIAAVTAKYEAEHIIRQAMGKIAVDLTYGDDNLDLHNSQGVNEAAMGVLTSVRHYLETYLEKGTFGPIVPGINSAYLWTYTVSGDDGTYALVHEIQYEPDGSESETYKGQGLHPKEVQ